MLTEDCWLHFPLGVRCRWLFTAVLGVKPSRWAVGRWRLHRRRPSRRVEQRRPQLPLQVTYQVCTFASHCHFVLVLDRFPWKGIIHTCVKFVAYFDWFFIPPSLSGDLVRNGTNNLYVCLSVPFKSTGPERKLIASNNAKFEGNVQSCTCNWQLVN